MLGNRWRDTKPEATVRSILHKRGRRFRKRLTIRLADRRWTQPDIVFVREKLAVFVDGCFWHCCPEHGTAPRTNSPYWSKKLQRNITRDRDTDSRLTAMGWTVLRAWEHEPPAQIADRVDEVLGRARASR
jgi:DNA mismatch endonuclease (patch repair protein)